MRDSATYKINKPIVLVGMMGVGKTTYGKKIAAILKVPFLDVDQLIENEIGHSISWLFEHVGEDKFRDMEEKKIEELLNSNVVMVIALGGGAFNNERTRERVKKKALAVWLKSRPETVLTRVSVRRDRPLLEGVDDKLGKIKQIMKDREGFYSQSDVAIATDEGNQRELPFRTLDKVQEFLDKGIA